MNECIYTKLRNLKLRNIILFDKTSDDKFWNQQIETYITDCHFSFPSQCSRFKFSQINLLVRPGAEYDGLDLVEVDIVDAAQVSRQFVENFSVVGIPDVDIPIKRGLAIREEGGPGLG